MARVVSLVPSLTEAIASVDAASLVGVTDWCSHPADLDTTRVRGTKNPDTKAIIALAPDVVIANKEENRELDVRRLRDAGVEVWVSVIETVPQAIDAMEELFDTVLRWERPEWLATVRSLWCGAPLPARTRVAVPIWRDPWMVVGRDTFTGDLLARAGLPHVFADHADRYPSLGLADIDGAGADLVLLPDEPYVFTATDGPEAFTRTPTQLMSGRLITWYGPSLVEAHAMLQTISPADPA
ncbi:helical backbone metal receptor [Nocardioides currus]|uniref:Cobalamin-binding protein n=1 Tax=Nocardioides currus TaxID=2133958 RepID=A0A2R7YTR1_9ACTN|nr:helical backbone metal receptor [Nocardioides currus]PUA79683.1 cobalamin-binding protein [Nocardioides currus]